MTKSFVQTAHESRILGTSFRFIFREGLCVQNAGNQPTCFSFSWDPKGRVGQLWGVSAVL